MTSGTGKFSKSHFLRELTVSAGRPLVREADYTPNRRERRFFRTYPDLTRFPESRLFGHVDRSKHGHFHCRPSKQSYR